MYSIILNSKNRVDVTNTTANNCEYNFDWGVLKEGKYKLTYSLSKCKIPLPLFQQLIDNKKPWAKYSPSSYSNNLWSDESGNNRHATCVNVVPKITVGNGSSFASGIACLSGTIASTISFPAGSIPSNYTICAITRYSSSGPSINRQRILTGGGFDNILIGHHGYQSSGQRGTIYDNGYIIQTLNSSSSNWLSLCVVRGNSIPFPNNILFDGVAVGPKQITNTVSGTLGINTSGYGEQSDFEVTHVLIWDTPLTSAELIIVSNALNTYRTTGVLL
jgi:hypothetical protein